MGFIDSAATVTVTAKLTDYGKKKLYGSIEGNSGVFISKFGLGDSDINYTALDGGVSVLGTGNVPEPSEFIPRMRSHALYSGKYEPSTPLIMANGDYGPDFYATLDVGVDEDRSIEMAFKTEWPKNVTYTEGYDVIVTKPTSINSANFSRLFTVTGLGGGRWRLTENVRTDADLEYVFGKQSENNTTVSSISVLITVRGKESNQVSTMIVDLIRYVP